MYISKYYGINEVKCSRCGKICKPKDICGINVRLARIDLNRLSDSFTLPYEQARIKLLEEIKKAKCKNCFMDDKKIYRMKIVCGDELKCQWKDCDVTNHKILSVRHVRGRRKDEYFKSGVFKKIEEVSDEVFEYNIKNDNYRIYCMNHGFVYEWGMIDKRLYKMTKDQKNKIKRFIHRLYLLGGKCKICGESDYNYLCGHHLVKKKKGERNLNQMNEDRFRELLNSNQLQCLCHNCHGLLHWK